MRKDPEMKKYTLYFDSYECTLEHFTFYATYEDAVKIMERMTIGFATTKNTVYALLYEGVTKCASYEIDK